MARITALFAIVVVPHAVLAWERPPTLPAYTVLGFELSGPNCVVDPVARSDGFMHVFRLRTRYGTYDVHGNHLIPVRTMLRELGVRDAIIDRMVNNRRYSPSDLSIMTSALTRLGIPSTEIFVIHAANAMSDEEVDFEVRRAEMLAAHGPALQVAEFVSIANFALNRTGDGRIVAVFPLDQLARTESAANAFNAVTTALRRDGRPVAAALALTGSATPMTGERLRGSGGP